MPREPLQVTAVATELPPVPDKARLPLPEGIDLRDIEVEIVDAGTTLTERRAVMSIADFEALLLNNADILRWVTEARAQLDYYRSSNVKPN